MRENDNLPANREVSQPILIPDEGVNCLRNVLSILFRHKLYIFVIFFSTVTFVTVFTLISPGIYQSDAKLFIQLGRESVSVDPSVVGPTTSVRSDRESELNSEVAALKSRVLVEQAVDDFGPIAILNSPESELISNADSQLINFGKNLLIKLGLKSPLPLSEIAVAKVMKNLTVVAEKQSYIINLAFRSESPGLARDILNVVISKYLDRHILMHRAQAPLQFFEQRADNLRVALNHKEEILKNFQEQNSMFAIEGQKGIVLEQVNLLQIEIDQVVSLIGASSAEIESIKSSLQGRSPNHEINRVVGLPNRTVEAIKDRIFELLAQEADLAARYPDTDRALIDLRDKIRLAENQLSQESVALTEITHGVDTNYQALHLRLADEQAQLQALNARQNILEYQLKERKADLLVLSRHEISLNGFQREIDIANIEYQRYREHLQRAKISEELDSGRISNVSIVQPPTMSLVPIKPRKALNILLGMLLGLSGGLGLAFFREYIDSTIKVPEDVENKLGLPVLASISRKEFEACI